MRHVLSFFAGAGGFAFGLVLAWVVFVVGLDRSDLFASRVVVAMALLPALVGHAVMDVGGRWAQAARARRNGVSVSPSQLGSRWRRR